MCNCCTLNKDPLDSVFSINYYKVSKRDKMHLEEDHPNNAMDRLKFLGYIKTSTTTSTNGVQAS